MVTETPLVDDICAGSRLPKPSITMWTAGGRSPARGRATVAPVLVRTGRRYMLVESACSTDGSSGQVERPIAFMVLLLEGGQVQRSEANASIRQLIQNVHIKIEFVQI